MGLLAGAVAADLAGADGVVCRFDRHGFVTAQELAAVRSAISTHLTIELDPEDSLVMQALELKPDQVTFVTPFEAESGIGVDLAMYAGEIKDCLRYAKQAVARGLDLTLAEGLDLEKRLAARLGAIVGKEVGNSSPGKIFDRITG